MGRGKLVFKGDDDDDKKAKKKKKKSKHSLIRDESATSSSIREEPNTISASGPAVVASTLSRRETKDVTAPKLQQGTGTITTSGTVVTGHETRFTRQVNVGDALLVTTTMIDGQQQQQQQEMRIITMRLSDTSLNLSSSFSQNLAQPTPFQYVPKPRDKAKEARLKQQKALQNVKEEEQQAFGTYGTTEELVYREKTEHGSYRIKRVKVDNAAGKAKNISRGDLLEMRTKKKSDKYC